MDSALVKIDNICKEKKPVVLFLKVSPGASRTRIREIVSENIDGTLCDLWRVQVNAPPENGKANRQVLELFATLFDLPEKCFKIEVGAHSTYKRLHIHFLS